MRPTDWEMAVTEKNRLSLTVPKRRERTLLGRVTRGSTGGSVRRQRRKESGTR